MPAPVYYKFYIMKKIRNIWAVMAVSALAFSCGEDKIQVVEPEAPVIESASLRGVSGETAVEAGESVVFTASVSVKGSTLGTYSVVVMKGTGILASAEGELKGENAVIEKELSLAVNAAGLSEDFVPEVTVKVTNTDGLFVEKKLSAEESVTVKAPEIFSQLYLTDNNGKVVTMKQTAVPGKYRTDGSLDGIGSSFSVSSAVTADGKADGKIWAGIDTPDPGEYGLVWIGFDILTGNVSKMIDYTVTLDYSKMADDAAEGYKVFWAVRLVQDCRCEFVNFPSGLKLQADRFDDVEGNTARYTGHNCVQNYEVYLIADINWLIVKFQWNVADAMWLTGANGSLPMVPYCEGKTLNWFDNSPNGVCATSTVSFMKTGSDNWRALVYLKSNFELKIYSGYGWGFEVSPLASATPETITVTPIVVDDKGNASGNIAVPGEKFTEGLYMLDLDSSAKEISLSKYSDAYLPVI